MSLLDVKELLRRFGIFVYTGNRLDDLILMEQELSDLYFEKLIDQEEYIHAKGILAQEIQTEKSKQ